MGFLQGLTDDQKEPEEQQQELDLENIYNSNAIVVSNSRDRLQKLPVSQLRQMDFL